MGTGSFLGVERPGHGVDHPPPSSAEVKERVELYLYATSGPLWPVIGQILINDPVLKKEGGIAWTEQIWFMTGRCHNGDHPVIQTKCSKFMDQLSEH